MYDLNYLYTNIIVRILNITNQSVKIKEFLRKTNSQDNNGLQLTKRIYELN